MSSYWSSGCCSGEHQCCWLSSCGFGLLWAQTLGDMQLLSLQDWSFQTQWRSPLVLAVADMNALGIALELGMGSCWF